MRYALINTTNELQRVQDFTDTPPAPLPEAKGLRWLEYIETAQPTFDAITQRLDATVTVDSRYTKGWAIVALDAPTIAANQAQAAQALQTSIVSAVQARLDTFAQTRNYDGILSAATYASSTVAKFAAEGQCAVNARDNTWATLYILMAEIQAGTRPVPTGYADFEPLLPALAWPV